MVVNLWKSRTIVFVALNKLGNTGQNQKGAGRGSHGIKKALSSG
jgi:hypothetical protein